MVNLRKCRGSRNDCCSMVVNTRTDECISRSLGYEVVVGCGGTTCDMRRKFESSSKIVVARLLKEQ